MNSLPAQYTEIQIAIVYLKPVLNYVLKISKYKYSTELALKKDNK